MPASMCISKSRMWLRRTSCAGSSEAQKRNPNGMIFLGFNRPRSSLFQRVMAALGGQSGPLMVNWFIAGHKIPDDHWYYSDAEGGRILGNLCHWTDLTLHMVGFENAFPCEITGDLGAGLAKRISRSRSCLPTSRWPESPSPPRATRLKA